MKKNISLVALLFFVLEAEVSMSTSQTRNIEPATINSKQTISVTVSAYSPTVEECDENPYITAYQKPVKEGTIAISRDLERELGWSLGDRIYITGVGVFEVWDRMHPKWKKRVDIFFHETDKAISFGVKQAKVIKVEKEGA